MLQQSLQINSIIGALRQFCDELRQGTEETNLVNFEASAAAMIDDLVTVIGLPAGSTRLIFNSAELDVLGVAKPTDDYRCKCQQCGEEATHLVHARRGWLLVCDGCEPKIKHD